MSFEEIIAKFEKKKLIYVAAGTVISIAAAFFFASYVLNSTAEKILKAKKDELHAFTAMKEEYLRERAIIEPIEKRLLLPQSKSISAMIEEICAQVNIRPKLASFKPVEDRAEGHYSQQGVEVKFESISLNQIMNFLYRVDNYTNLVIIKEFMIRARFDNPELFDAVMKIFVITRE